MTLLQIELWLTLPLLLLFITLWTANRWFLLWPVRMLLVLTIVLNAILLISSYKIDLGIAG